MIFSEKEAVWTKFSTRINVGDIFAGRVGSVEDYGAFVHLRFPDGIMVSDLALVFLRFLYFTNLIVGIPITIM